MRWWIVRLGSVRCSVEAGRCVMAATTMSPADHQANPQQDEQSRAGAARVERKRAETSCSDPSGIRRRIRSREDGAGRKQELG